MTIAKHFYFVGEGDCEFQPGSLFSSMSERAFTIVPPPYSWLPASGVIFFWFWISVVALCDFFGDAFVMPLLAS